MAILSTCCCRYTLRKGSFVCGVYTLIYFFLFALLTGNYSYHEVSGRIFGGGNQNTTGQAQVSNAEVVIICVDFVCEISGFFGSIWLIRGLYMDKKEALLPWMVIVPLHTIIDSITVINIIILYVEHKEEGGGGGGDGAEIYWGIVTLFTVILDFILNFINVYAFLCVMSQYQEYSAGRGTAAYEGLAWEEASVRYEARGGGGSSIVGGGGGMNGRNPCFSDENKSDVWCEDLVLDKLDPLEENPTPPCGPWGPQRRKSSCVRWRDKGCPDEGEEEAATTSRPKTNVSIVITEAYPEEQG